MSSQTSASTTAEVEFSTQIVSLTNTRAKLLQIKVKTEVIIGVTTRERARHVPLKSPTQRSHGLDGSHPTMFHPKSTQEYRNTFFRRIDVIYITKS